MEEKEENSDYAELYARHQKLKSLASNATREYDELLKNYIDIQNQHQEVNNRLIDSETQLNKFESTMQERVGKLEEEMSQLKEERDDAVAKEQKTTAKCKRLEAELGKLHEKLSGYQTMLNKLSRYSTLILDEFSEVKEGYERELALKQAAELYACEMRTQRDASFRQSSVLLSSAAGDMRLMEAMMEIENLSKQHASELRASDEKIKSLEAALEVSSDWNNMKKLEEKLELSSGEIERMRTEIEELEKVKSEIAAENSELKEQLTRYTTANGNGTVTAPSLIAPPPPPPMAPPPPPLLACPGKLIFPKPGQKQESVSDSPFSPKTPGDGKQLMIQDAMKEMMERIQTGKLLSGGVSLKIARAKASDTSPSSAVNNLQELLTKLKDRRNGSVDDSAGYWPTRETRPSLPADTRPKVQPPPVLNRNNNFSLPKTSPIHRQKPSPFLSGAASYNSASPPHSSEASELERTFKKIANKGIVADSVSSSSCSAESRLNGEQRNAGLQLEKLPDECNTKL